VLKSKDIFRLTPELKVNTVVFQLNKNMNNITIKFSDYRAKSPKYTFNSRVAMRSNCDPSKWAIGRVTGLRLDDDNIWNYNIVFDYPLGYCDELTESELAPESEFACVS
jgi:hypothetical protein